MRAILCLLAALAFAPGRATAQVLSPGPLSAAHAELQGIRQCTACHQLGQRGASMERCLTCHEALGVRLRAGTGYHATVKDRTCGSCHAEHYGRDFALVRIDTTTFDHATTRFTLRAAHAAVSCRACHRATNVQDPAVRQEKKTAAALERTFLGLATSCRSCHSSDDPHGRQFGTRDCTACHGETNWEEATSFDHATAAFRLTGKHRSVACSACHAEKQGVTRYTGVPHQRCTSCHADVHRGGQGGTCETCHTTAGWRAFGSGFDTSRFDHASTRFTLRAAHARIDCLACHRTPARSDARIRITLAGDAAGSRFPALIARDCRSCHVAAHPGPKPGHGAGANCSACHSEDAWSPASFGMREHAATRFALDGAHVLLACTRCHSSPAPGRLTFQHADISCSGCHTDDSPHGLAYADAKGRTECVRCHATRSWQPSATEHDTFPLTGAHAQVACASCHRPERAATPRGCAACHAANDPHQGQSAGRPCEACHDTSGFTGALRFDHGTTRYPLEGAHRRLVCSACHAKQPSAPGTLVLRYSLLPTRCEACHAP